MSKAGCITYVPGCCVSLRRFLPSASISQSVALVLVTTRLFPSGDQLGCLLADVDARARHELPESGRAARLDAAYERVLRGVARVIAAARDGDAATVGRPRSVLLNLHLAVVRFE